MDILTTCPFVRQLLAERPTVLDSCVEHARLIQAASRLARRGILRFEPARGGRLALHYNSPPLEDVVERSIEGLIRDAGSKVHEERAQPNSVEGLFSV